MAGWVKLERDFLESDLWLAEPFTKAQAWVDLFGLANHEERTLWIRGVEIKVKRGQTARSELSLAKKWKWSRKKVRSFLKMLEREQQIEQQKSNVTTLISITNYEKYQGQDTPNGTPKDTPKEHQKNTKGYTNKNEKNYKNEKNISTVNTVLVDEPDGPSTPAPENCPHKEIRGLYNQILGDTLPQCKITTTTFDKMLRTRWRESKDRQSLDWWTKYFNYIRESDFLMGRTDNDFMASFEWVIRPTNMAKIINGNYHKKGKKQQSIEEYAREHGYV